MNKKCSKCRIEKPVEVFGPRWRKRKRDGARLGPYLQSWCLECRREHNGRSGPRRAERKAKLIELHGGSCSRCRGVFPVVCYDFHHKNQSDKEYWLTDLYDKSWDRLMAEAAKCDLLCANCHRILHAEERGITYTPNSKRRGTYHGGTQYQLNGRAKQYRARIAAIRARLREPNL